jgi:hypothetical protein
VERLASVVDELREFTLLLEDSDSDMTLLAPEVPVTSEIPALVGVNRVEPWLLGEAGILAVAPGDESSQMDLSDEGSSLSDLTDLTEWSDLDLPEIPMPVPVVDLTNGFFQVPVSPAFVPVSPAFVPVSPPFVWPEGVLNEGGQEEDHHSEWSTEAVVNPMFL